MKRAVVIAVVILLAAAYLGGFWPEHQRLTTTRQALEEVQPRLASAEAKVRLGEVLGQQMRLADAIDARNFGEASGLSSTFFDRVQQEQGRATDPAVRSALDEVAATRDQVTSAIARTDPAVSGILRQQELALRRALGYPVPSAPAAAPMQAPAN
jgi:hypothetical protein